MMERSGGGTMSVLNDKIALNKLRDAIDNALRPVCSAFELDSLKSGRISYDGSGTSAKITLNAKAKSADGKTQEEVAFQTYHTLFGFKPEHLHARFKSNGNEYELIGFMPSRRKYPGTGAQCGNW